MSTEELQLDTGNSKNIFHNKAPITNAAQRDFKVREQRNQFTTNVQEQYVSYYNPSKSLEWKGGFAMVPISMATRPYIGNEDLVNVINNTTIAHSQLAVWGRGGIGCVPPR